MAAAWHEGGAVKNGPLRGQRGLVRPAAKRGHGPERLLTGEADEVALLTLDVESLDSSNCPGCGGSVFDLALRGRSVGKRVGELVDNPQGYPSGRPGVCPHGAAEGGIVLALCIMENRTNPFFRVAT